MWKHRKNCPHISKKKGFRLPRQPYPVISVNGRQKYAVITDADSNMMEKYARVLREGFLSVDAAENIVVIKTVSGMAGAVAAAVDAMRMQEIVGSLAGDDTILCVIRTSDDAVHIMKKLRKIVEQ